MPNPSQFLLQRSLWIKTHVYLGLTAGLLFALLGITGSLSIYRDELDEWLNPRLVVANPAGAYQSLDKIMAQVRLAHPNRHDEWVLEMPRSPHGMITAWYEKPHETFGEYYAPLMVSVNPYTAEVIASRFWGHTFVTWMDDVHTHLQLGWFGARMVGWLGLGLLASCLSGLYLWWPKSLASLRSAWSLRHEFGLARFAHDLHRWVGLVSVIGLLVLSFTGFNLAFPQVLATLTAAPDLGHGNGGPGIRSTAVPNPHPISLSEAVSIAQGLFPHAELRRVATPAGETGTYRINLRRPEEPNFRHPYTLVWVDRWSGQIREVRNPNRFSAGQNLITRLWPLHTGESLNALGRLVWFISGLAPAALFATGLVQWLIKQGILADQPIDLHRWQGNCRRIARSARHQAVRLSGHAYQGGLWAIKQIVRLARLAKQQ